MKAQRILVPIDFSEPSRHAMHEADLIAEAGGGRLTLVHVHPIVEIAVMDFTYVQPPEKVARVCEAVEARLREWAATLRTPAERIAIKVTTGAPVSELCELSKQFDLIVMSTHGHSGMTHFLLGSTTEKVVHGSAASVLVIKKPRVS